MKTTIPAAAREPDPIEEEAVKVARTMKLDKGLGFLIRVIDTRMNLLFQSLTKQEDITPRQFGVLLTLYQQGPLTLTDLAVAIRVDRSTLSEMINRMVDRSLIGKRGNVRDRRSAEVLIAPGGEAAMLQIIRGVSKLQNALLAPLPVSERAHFLRCVKLIADAQDNG